MKKKWYEHSNRLDQIGWLLVVMVFVANIFIIFKGTRAFIHSDGATAILYAREQWEQKALYPQQWNYGTDIWNVGLNTIIIPLLKICSSWLTARAWAVVIQTVIALVVTALFQKVHVFEKRIWMVLLLLLLPVSEVVSEHFYFQATYMTMMIYLAAMILLSLLCISSRRGKRIVGYILLFGLLVFRVGTGYAMILVFSAPMMLSFFAAIVLELHKGSEKDISKIKKYVYVMAVIAIGTLLGMIYNGRLTERLNLNVSAVSNYEFIPYNEIGQSFLHMCSCFMRLFGAADKPCSLLSLGGINKCISFVYMIFMLGYVPVSLLRRFQKVLNEKQKLVFLFTLFSSFFVCYLFVISGMDHARYLLWVYYYSIINFGIWICKFRSFEYEYAKEIKVMVIGVYVMLVMGVYGYYLTYNYSINSDSLGVNNNSIDNQVDYDLIDYLEEKGYKRGYGLYWQTYSYMVASDGNLSMAAIDNEWKGPYKWLNSSKWYENTGEPCFVLVTKWQYEQMPEKYKEKCYKTEKFHEYKILLYHNTGEVQSLWES